MFFGTASTSRSGKAHQRAQRLNCKKSMVYVLRSGIWTRNNFLHSFGLVMCAGTKGYWGRATISQGADGTGKKVAHHERLEVRSPPLRKAVPNLPLIVHSVRRIELTRLGGRRESVVQTLLEPLNLILSRLQVVTRTVVPSQKQA